MLLHVHLRWQATMGSSSCQFDSFSSLVSSHSYFPCFSVLYLIWNPMFQCELYSSWLSAHSFHCFIQFRVLFLIWERKVNFFHTSLSTHGLYICFTLYYLLRKRKGFKNITLILVNVCNGKTTNMKQEAAVFKDAWIVEQWDREITLFISCR